MTSASAKHNTSNTGTSLGTKPGRIAGRQNNSTDNTRAVAFAARIHNDQVRKVGCWRGGIYQRKSKSPQMQTGSASGNSSIAS